MDNTKLMDGIIWNEGMTLREYYAGILLAGMLSDPNVTVSTKNVQYAIDGADELIKLLKK